jgi:hypothetical protein
MNPKFVQVTEVAAGATCAGRTDLTHGPVTTVYLLPFSRWVYLCDACALQERARLVRCTGASAVLAAWWDVEC